MLVPDEVRSCVCFLYRRTDGNLVPEGTALLVAQTISDSGRVWVFLVTARHVVNSIETYSDDNVVMARFNVKGGGVDWVELPVKSWKFDENDVSTDIAIAQFVPPDHLEIKLWPIDRFATADVIAAQQIGLGDEVVITGLFAMHKGESRNLPIVRIGNIAAMPEEPVLTTLGPTSAYLIEARSIGGLSGSPVFVNVGQDRSRDVRGSILLGGSLTSHNLFLLGVLHGHWDVPADIPGKDGLTAVDGPGRERVNVGMAIVTPATSVLEIWKREPDAAKRVAVENMIRRSRQSAV